MSNDKAQATTHPNAPQGRDRTNPDEWAKPAPEGWDRSRRDEWAPVPASASAPHQQINVTVAAPRRRTNHGLHALLSLVTLGGWVPVWIVVAITNRSHG